MHTLRRCSCEARKAMERIVHNLSLHGQHAFSLSAKMTDFSSRVSDAKPLLTGEGNRWDLRDSMKSPPYTCNHTRDRDASST